MLPLKKQISDMVEQLHEPEQKLVFEIVKRFLSDDTATPDDLQAIVAARSEYSKGETVKDSEINWQ